MVMFPSKIKVFFSPSFRTITHQARLTHVTQENGVRKVTLNNPSKRNALSLAMIHQLQADILQNTDDDNLRCIVIDHNGPAFSSGHDLKELSAGNIQKRQEIFSQCSELMVGIRRVPVPVIAVVNGIAAAAGCQLLASCDIGVASEKSLFSTPGASVGLFCSTPGIAVSRNVPLKASAYMLLTGSNVSAREAVQWGLISKIAEEEKLNKVVYQIVQDILLKSRSVLALGKRFFYDQLDKDIESAYRCGSEVMVDNLARSEAEEGIRAFFEKRPPKW